MHPPRPDAAGEGGRPKLARFPEQKFDPGPQLAFEQAGDADEDEDPVDGPCGEHGDEFRGEEGDTDEEVCEERGEAVLLHTGDLGGGRYEE